MPEIPFDAREVARRAADQANATVAALMIAAVSQFRAEAGSDGHRYRTAAMLELSERAANVEFVKPETAIFAVARAAAAMVNALAREAGVDPLKFMESYEWALFLEQSSSAPNDAPRAFEPELPH